MLDTSSIVGWSSVALCLCNVVLCQQINCKPKDCIDLKCYRVSTGQDGPHTVYPGIVSLPSVNVSCDQTVLGGGWTVWLRRCLQTNDTNFNRTWVEYKNGFGRQEGANSEFYLGNEIVHLLTNNYSSGNGEFRIEAISYNDTSYGLSTDGFSLESEADKYRLRVGMEHDNVNVSTGAMLLIKDQQFTTGVIELCINRYKNMYWWFNDCTHFFFFGRHGNPKTWTLKYLFIVDDKNEPISMKRVHMLFRPYGDTRQCDNPCMNGATCEYVAASDTSRCKCPSTHCGAFCEKTCKN
ncbi:Ryncolin-4, partial [Lamellibrachia satsuma]